MSYPYKESAWSSVRYLRGSLTALRESFQPQPVDEHAVLVAASREKLATSERELQAFLDGASFDASIDEVAAAMSKLEAVRFLRGRLTALTATPVRPLYEQAAPVRQGCYEQAGNLEARRKELDGEIAWTRNQLNLPYRPNIPASRSASLSPTERAAADEKAVERAMGAHSTPLQQRLKALEDEASAIDEVLAEYAAALKEGAREAAHRSASDIRITNINPANQ